MDVAKQAIFPSLTLKRQLEEAQEKLRVMEQELDSMRKDCKGKKRRKSDVSKYFIGSYKTRPTNIYIANFLDQSKIDCTNYWAIMNQLSISHSANPEFAQSQDCAAYSLDPRFVPTILGLSGPSYS